jgi:hypothetical protein
VSDTVGYSRFTVMMAIKYQQHENIIMLAVLWGYYNNSHTSQIIKPFVQVYVGHRYVNSSLHAGVPEYANAATLKFYTH